MKLTNILAALSLMLFVGCGGGSGEQQQQKETASENTSSNVRTINIIGVDQMKYTVKSDAEGISVGDPVGSDNLLELNSISVKPGEKIRIVLTTKSQLPPTSMAHNWILLKMGTDASAFAQAALKAKDNDYVPSEKKDQIIAQTGLTPGGKTSEVTFTAPEKTGDYDFLCTFPGHFSAGMKGVLKVEESGSEM